MTWFGPLYVCLGSKKLKPELGGDYYKLKYGFKFGTANRNGDRQIMGETMRRTDTTGRGCTWLLGREHSGMRRANISGWRRTSSTVTGCLLALRLLITSLYVPCCV